MLYIYAAHWCSQEQDIVCVWEMTQQHMDGVQPNSND